MFSFNLKLVVDYKSNFEKLKGTSRDLNPWSYTSEALPIGKL